MQKFCISCGEKTDDLEDNLCFECFSKKIELIKISNRLELIMCKRCKKILHRGKWIDFENMDEMIEHAIYNNIKTFEGVLVKIYYKTIKISGKTNIPISLKGELNVGSKKLSEDKKVELVMLPTICNICNRMSGNYYESVIQLRTPEDQKILGLIKRKINELNKNDNLSFITKVENLKKGKDVYIGSKIAALRASKEIKKIYKAEIKKSYTLKGVKKGKRIYRTTISIKLK